MNYDFKKFFRYLFIVLGVYYTLRYFEEKKELKRFYKILEVARAKKELENTSNNNTETLNNTPETPSLDIRGGGPVEDFLVNRLLKLFNNKLIIKHVMIIAMVISIMEQSNTTLLKELLYNSTVYGTADLYKATKSQVNAEAIVENVGKLASSGVSDEVITDVVKGKISFMMKSVFLRRQLRKCIKRLGTLGTRQSRLFWISILILIFLNTTTGTVGILEAIRRLVAEGVLPPEVLEELME